MCVGVPEQLAECLDITGRTVSGRIVDLSLTPDARSGDWVLTHLGSAREIITEAEAALIAAALEGLGRVMAGGTAGDAFADLDARAPSLPPHLEAARAAGKTTA